MAQRIMEDWYYFRQIVAGRVRQELKGRISTGSIFRSRPNGKSLRIPIPKIYTPHFVHTMPDEGVGRGPGKKGDQIKKGKKPGEKGKPGKGAGEGMMVDVDMEEFIKLFKDELQLPELQPKPNQTFEEVRTVYNGVSKVGPRSLLHKRRMMHATMKRLAAMGQLDDEVLLPGLCCPVTTMIPINDDRRFRQYNEIKVPSSNAIIFFLRDGSGSMDNTKCEIVSDIAWWLNLWISYHYKKTERCFIWHDTEARELSEKEFFGLRNGGGTYCTSAMQLMNKIIKTRYSPVKWNIYGFYFGDGESAPDDNEKFSKMLKNQLGPKVVNMFGQVEILNYGWGDYSLKGFLDKKQANGELGHLRNTEIKRPKDSHGWGPLDDDYRDAEVKRVLKALLGKTSADREGAKNSVEFEPAEV